MSLLQVLGVCRREEGIEVLKEVSFDQQQLQKIAIAGATGSGKTTLLKVIAGLTQPHSGSVIFNGERVEGPEEKLLPGNPHIAYLSQHFELRNNYRVEDLIEMASKLTAQETKIICQLCRVEHLLKRWTHQLSGGERQRIALAKTLVANPQLLLLDEPYSNLDAIHKTILKSVLLDIEEHLQVTTILVSHDPLDTLSWADTILILKNGQIIQQGTPQQVYSSPVDEYAAALFGRYVVMSPMLAKSFSAFTDLEMSRINSFFRPEDFKIVSQTGQGIKGAVEKVAFMGGYYEIEVSVADGIIQVRDQDGKFRKGDVVYVSLEETCQQSNG